MSVFRRRPKVQPSHFTPALNDGAWLKAGQARYDSLVSNHYGSPDTIAAGGAGRLREDDVAAALFFFQKAVDTLHSIYVCSPMASGPNDWSRQPSGLDLEITDRYLGTLRVVRWLRPSAPVGRSVREVTHRLRTISSQFGEYGLDKQPYLDRLVILGELAPDVEVSDLFW